MIRKYPGVYLLGFVVAGIVFADQTRLPGWSYFVTALVACSCGTVLLKYRQAPVAAIALGCALGLASACHFAQRYVHRGPSDITRAGQTGERYRFYGEVCDWPELKPGQTEITVSLDSIKGTSVTPATGVVLLKVAGVTTRFERGDYLEFCGRLYPISERPGALGFDYGRYCRLRGVAAIVYSSTMLDVWLRRERPMTPLALIDRLRHEMRGSLNRNLSETGAALAAGYLIGDTRDIPPRVYKLFRDSGTLHLLAVSGSNVALVLVFTVFLLRPIRLERVRRAAVLTLVIVVFLLVSYAEPSVVRASLMAVLVLAAGLLQRRYDLNNVIAVAALAILLWDPAQLFHVGFQLSFATAWGLVFVTPKLMVPLRSWSRTWWYRFLLFPVAVAVVAQLCSGPIVAYHFNRLPYLSPLANLVIIPLVSVGVVGVLCLLGTDLIWPLLARFVGSLLDQVLGVTVSLLELLGGDGVPVASVAAFPAWRVLVLLGLVFVGALAVSSRRVLRYLIITVLIGANAFLASEIRETVSEPWRRRVSLVAIPGGIMSVVRTRGAGRADVIITGLQVDRLPFDDRVGRPLLDQLGVTRLASLFVQSADYNAIEQLLRWARCYGADTMYVHPSLEASFADVLRYRVDPACSPAIVAWPNGATLSTSPGYHLESMWLRLTCGPFSLCFCRQGDPVPTATGSLPGRPVLIGGCDLGVHQPGQPGRSWWARICSEVDQLPVREAQGPGGGGHVYDLTLTGPVHLDLPADTTTIRRIETGP